MNIVQIKETALKFIKDSVKEIKAIKNQEDLKQIKAVHGKATVLSKIKSSIKDLDDKDKPVVGALLNKINDELEAAYTLQKNSIDDEEIKERLKSNVDLSINPFDFPFGSTHPLNQLREHIINFFAVQGYTYFEGPEVEEELYNFERLNLPKEHPAREMQDTFYTEDGRLLITHQTNVTARLLESQTGDDIRGFAIGNVFRNDEDDATHSHQFSQLDFFYVGKSINIENLIWTIKELIKHVFHEEREMRLRPSYFPFTEPSFEVDMVCMGCDGKGCPICKGTGWVEILGCGMLHPNVMKMAKKPHLQGFAVGVGLERLAMLKWGINDIRVLYENNAKMLNQFKQDLDYVNKKKY